jgi:hypothetical protein
MTAPDSTIPIIMMQKIMHESIPDSPSFEVWAIISTHCYNYL